MKTYVYVFAAAAALSLASCSKGEKALSECTVLDVEAAIDMPDTPDFTWNDVADSVWVVPLVSPDDQPLASMQIYDITDDGFAVMSNMSDPQGVYFADINDGTMSGFVREGKAGYEYTCINDIQVIGDSVYVTDIIAMPTRVRSYDRKGNYGRTIESYGRPYVLDADNILSVKREMDVEMGGMLVDVVAMDGSKSTGYIAVEDELPRDGYNYARTKRTDKGMFIQPFPDMHNDTVYLFQNDVPEPYVVYDFGSYSSSTHRSPEMKVEGNRTSYIPTGAGANMVSMWGDAMVVFVRKDDKSGTVIFNNGKPIAKATDTFACVLPNGKSVGLYGIYVFGDKLIQLFDAYRLEGIVDGIDENDNPVMVVVRLKTDI